MTEPTTPPDSTMTAQIATLFPDSTQREHKYILDDKRRPVPISDVIKWGEWMEQERRQYIYQSAHSGVMVSTVFLWLDHCWMAKAPPMLWETMIFSKRHSRKNFENKLQWRYETEEEAMRMHNIIFKTVKSGYSTSWIIKRLEEL